MRGILLGLGTPAAYSGLTAPQLAFVLNAGKRRTNHAGRRSGKTYAILRWLVAEWETRPGQTSIFVATSQGHAMSIGWETFRMLAREMRWSVEPNKQAGTYTFPNGFMLAFDGAKDRPSADRLRGWPKVWRINIDECGAFSSDLLEYTVQSVTEPMLGDTDGDISLSGTPHPLGEGFYDDMMDQWNNDFQWDARSNPHLAIPGETYLRQTLEANGWTVDHPTFRREYLGDRVKESNVLIYPVGYETYETAPLTGYTTLGVDIGWDDGFGFTVARSRAPLPGAHVLESFAESHMGFGRACAVIERLMREYKCSEGFIDTAGGGGRTLSESFAMHCTINVKPVIKAGIRNQIELVRSLLAAETLKGTRGKSDQLFTEMRRIPWDDKRQEHRPNYADECTNGLQYALTGPGFSMLTPWSVEVTPEEQYWKEIEKRKKAIRAERRHARNRR